MRLLCNCDDLVTTVQCDELSEKQRIVGFSRKLLGQIM